MCVYIVHGGDDQRARTNLSCRVGAASVTCIRQKTQRPLP
jgi:hypothetical protein